MAQEKTNNIAIAKKIFISGRIKTETGLHIGGTGTGIEIGGLDKGAVIRDPISGEPYIPGSSTKGKMRSLLEKLRGEYEIDEDGKAGPSRKPEAISARLFGMPADENNDDKTVKNDEHFRASRLIVRDAFLTEESREALEKMDLELPFTEVRTENAIDRITSKANPRSIERVPRETEFKLDMTLTVYENDNEDELKEALFLSMRMLQEDYLGGHGSRGSGKIKITIDEIKEKKKAFYLTGKQEESQSIEIPNDFKE